MERRVPEIGIQPQGLGEIDHRKVEETTRPADLPVARTALGCGGSPEQPWGPVDSCDFPYPLRPLGVHLVVVFVSHPCGSRRFLFREDIVAPPFRTRFGIDEIGRLAPQIPGAVKAHASDNAGIVKLGGDLGDIGASIAALSRPGGLSIRGADKNRDMLVRALATGIEFWTYRIDVPEKQAAAFRAQDALFKDGFGWIHDAFGAETTRIGSLLTAIAKPAVAADLALIGLTDCAKAVGAYQHAFLDAEKGRGAAADLGPEVTRKQHALAGGFHLKLDLYVAVVGDTYQGDAKVKEREGLLKPLVDATGRERASEGPKGGAKPAAAPPTSP